MFVLPIVPGALFSKTVQSALAPKEIYTTYCRLNFGKKLRIGGLTRSGFNVELTALLRTVSRQTAVGPARHLQPPEGGQH